MARKLTIGAAQLGPIQRSDSRASVVKRLIHLPHQAHERGCRLVIYPEMALTSFFPRWYMTDQSEVDAFFECEMPNASTRPLFEEARRLGIGFYLGYAEIAEENGERHHYNAAILTDGTGKIIGKYRKIHLPGHSEYDLQRPFQHFEKRYYE